MPAITAVFRYAQKNRSVNDVEFRIHHLDGTVPGLKKVCNDIENSDLMLTDLMGLGQPMYSQIVESIKKCKGQRLSIGGMAPPLSRLGGYDAAAFKMNERDEENISRIFLCWKRAGDEDIEYVMNMLLREYFGHTDLPEMTCPAVKEGVYIKDPLTSKEYDGVEEYVAVNPKKEGRGEVALIFSGNSYPMSSLKCVASLFKGLDEFANVTPVAMNSYNIGCASDLKALVGSPDVMINILPFRFMSGPMGGDSVSATGLLEEIDASYLSPFILTRSSKEEWQSKKAGLDPMEFMINVFLPELDGSLCTIPLGTKEDVDAKNEFGLALSTTEPLEDRIRRICGKVRNYIELRNKPNSEKKVAIISYNYPPGEGNLFGGSFLDGAGSLSKIMEHLSSEGYSVKGMAPDDIVDTFIKNGILNEGKWMASTDLMIEYKGDSKHPDAVTGLWGEAPGDILTSNGKYQIPGILDGNVFIGLQPPRLADPADSAGKYHDMELLPHHQYLAMYEWIRDVFKADAVIHLGTHGTLEFLPGKECAMSSSCYPDMLMDDSVHIYLYYSGNPSEAMIAKRRSHACIVSYMPPPFIRSGLYGELVELEENIAEYRESIKADEGRAGVLHDAIMKKAESMRLPTEIEELEDEMVSMRNSLIPRGLHRFGVPYEQEDAERYAIDTMDFPHEGIVPLHQILDDPERAEDAYRRFNLDGHVDDSLKGNDQALKCLEFERQLMRNAMETDELKGLSKALEGRYIGAKPGGDIRKGPELLPTGYNIVQFNPDRIPTAAAFDRGVQAAEEAVTEYLKNTGEYPKGAALVLWGIETSRTQGMSIGQICGYLGIRLVKTSGEFIKRFSVIPISELGRPRVDVTVNMCGFFRDMFPNLIKGLGDLFEMVSSLDEPEAQNPCRANTQRNRRYLKDSGYTQEEADDLSSCRLFGPANGEYGTSITGAVNSGSWKEEEELGNLFVDGLRYAYSRNSYGTDARGLLNLNHSGTDIVSQVRDSADREIIDLDHYYEFLGGLSKAVETARGGRKAEVYVVDGSGNDVRTYDIKRSVERGVRTRLLNPKWIDGLLEVKYHGAQKINDRFENVLGLAATTGGVETGVFKDMFDCYVRDEEMRKRMQENNNWAYISMLERLFEAQSRSYWDATDEELSLLRDIYERSEEIAEDETDTE